MVASTVHAVIYDPVCAPPHPPLPPTAERSSALRPHLRAGGDDPGVAAAAQEEEAAGQEPLQRQQQRLAVCEWRRRLCTHDDITGGPPVRPLTSISSLETIKSLPIHKGFFEEAKAVSKDE